MTADRLTATGWPVPVQRSSSSRLSFWIVVGDDDDDDWQQHERERRRREVVMVADESGYSKYILYAVSWYIFNFCTFMLWWLCVIYIYIYIYLLLPALFIFGAAGAG